MSITAVTKDASGRLISWNEDEYTFAVVRDSSGKPLTIRGTSAGRKGIYGEFRYTTAGVFTGLVGSVASAMIASLVLDATGATSGGGSSANQVGVYNLTPSSTAKGRAALGKAKTGIVNRLVVAVSGDSTSCSLWANSGNSGTLNAFTEGVCGQLKSILGTLTGMTVTNHSTFGDNYLGANYINANPKAQMSGSVLTTTSGLNSSSLGGQAFLFNANGHKVTFSFDTQIDTFYTRNLGNFGYGNVAITVDGGVTGFKLNGTGADVTTQNISGNHAPSFDVTKFTVAKGTHTVEATWTTALNTGQLALYGVDAYDSTTPHIAIWNFGESGGGMTNKANQPTPTTTPWAQLPALVTTAPLISWYILNCTINDMVLGTDPALYETRLNAVLDGVQGANINTQILLVAGNATSHPTETTNRPALVAALQRASVARNVPFVDLEERFGNFATVNALGQLADDRHPNKGFLYAIAGLYAWVITN